MVKRFKNDEARYLSWVQGNPTGYVVNVNEPQYASQYPMVHAASHKAISSPARSNYTTGSYIKVCSTDLDALEQWSQGKYGRALTRCARCM